MRQLFLLAFLVPSAAVAEDISLRSGATEALVFPHGASVVREVAYEAPAGEHRLVISDLPLGTPLDSLRIALSNGTMGAVTLREEAVPPVERAKTPAMIAAQAEIDRLEDALAALGDEQGVIDIRIQAADSRIAYLRQLQRGESEAALDVGRVAELGQMIEREVADAATNALAARKDARALAKRREAVSKELVAAHRALAALVPEQEERVFLAVEMSAPEAVAGVMRIVYQTPDAGWYPVYDFRLDRTKGDTLDITRGAFVYQNTGENWEGVHLTLSTASPTGQTAPSRLWPELLRIHKPRPQLAKMSQRAPMSLEMAEADAAVPMAEPAVVNAQMSSQLEGIRAEYRYPKALTLASGADAVRISLGAVSLTPETYARAVPSRDETAFLMAEITNDSGEMLLPSSEVTLYLDGQYVGRTGIEMLANGDTESVSFGPIEGLRLSQRLQDRNEGDRGVISRVNEKTESRIYEITNLTSQSWDVRLLAQVPYSEQEDLAITWDAKPRPTVQQPEGQHGVMAWHFTLPAEKSREISLNHQIRWPTDMELR